ncbi:GAF and ANTAR domain-containing protein [Quadrisphaera sp. KR29]|uniref:GAF and ANTAR domain-containing protein n=1 Tax=Quadrisphaera sp. KR29 TaxID=3461391 RepID=UPI004044AE0E
MDVEDHGTTPHPGQTHEPDQRAGASTDGRSARAGRHRAEPSTADSGAAADLDVLARQLADLARDLQGAATAQDVLDRAVATAVDLVPGAAAGSISLVRARRQVTSVAVTDPAGRRLDELQNEVGEGPCLDAAFAHRSTRVDDLAAETERWPALAARAAEVGMPSVLCLQLYVDGDNLGALNLLGAQAGAFSDASEHVGLLLAAHAAVAVADAQKQENLGRGLANRDVIGQAKGILMERHKLSPDQAFAVLSQLSQDLNRKLYDIAADLSATGELPGRPRSTAGGRTPRPPSSSPSRH